MMAYTRYKPGEIWNDTDGRPIQAHGGGILFHEGRYYWYGENKDGETLPSKMCEYRVNVVGISCYSSSDLLNWRNEGVVISANSDNPDHDLHISKVVERPKVIYNVATDKFVMWLHIDNEEYSLAAVGVAIAETPTGPFRFLYSMHPNGLHSRDFTVFKDTDDRAYLLHSSNWNKTLMIAELTSDYLGVTGIFSKQFIDRSREAPSLFKIREMYYLITSGCTGWDPNEAELAVSRSIHGPWDILGNPCRGSGAETTFLSQSTFVLPIEDANDRYIFMADRWNKHNLRDSRYVWLPLLLEVDGSIRIEWRDEWELGSNSSSNN